MERIDEELAVKDPPFLIGLHGNMGTGKTYLASHLADPSSPVVHRPNGKPEVWSHMYFAMGIKRLLNTRLQITGDKAYDRTLYSIHQALIEILGGNPLFGAPRYNDLIQTVYEIQELPVDPNAEKHRDFMQQVGAKIRAHNKNAWVNYIHKKIQEEDSRPEPLVVVLSDVRYKNEADLIKAYGGMLIKLTADADTILDRLLDRDGEVPTKEQVQHESEAYKPDDSEFDLVLDTTNRDVIDLVMQVRSAYNNRRFANA